jgi:hypothetical protein
MHASNSIIKFADYTTALGLITNNHETAYREEVRALVEWCQEFRCACLLGRVAKKNPYLRLANKNERLRWAKEHRHWTEELCLGQHSRFASSLLTLRLVFCGDYLKVPVEDL